MKFLLALFVCYGASAAGAWFTSWNLQGWYQNLQKPTWNPPDWVFAPVWAVLYFLLAVNLWQIWSSTPNPRRTRALRWFALQLVLNVAWSALFFGAKMPSFALINICLLAAAIGGTILTSGRINRLAGALLIPYLVWVLFALALNAAIWKMNS